MNKTIPLAILLTMILMLGISWYNVSEYKSSVNAEYDGHIEAAEEFMTKDIYIDAVKEYEAALKLRPNDYDVAIKIMDLYDKLEDQSSYIKACQSAINADPTQPHPYIQLANCYNERMNYSKAYETLSHGMENADDVSEISLKISELKGEYSLLSMEYDSFDGWVYINNETNGYARVSKNGEYGLLKSDNRLTIKCEYEDIGILSDDLMPVKLKDEYYYATSKGYRKLVTDHTSGYLGCFSEGYAAAKLDDDWGYIDKNAKEYQFEYQYAGSFANGIAAVQKDGKWGLINTSFKTVVDFELDDVLLDEYGFCSTYGVVWVRKEGKYYLYNLKGECISDGYDDAKMFASEEPAAVKTGNQWGFVSKKGELVIKPAYKDANSFSLGYAPYCENGKWGCIDENGNTLIEPTFDAMSSFARNGYAYAEVDGIKKFVVVSIYE